MVMVVGCSVLRRPRIFPPTSRNKISLANGTTVAAPLGGYQYVPCGSLLALVLTVLLISRTVETVEPGNDRSLESWTDCPVSDRSNEPILFLVFDLCAGVPEAYCLILRIRCVQGES